MGNWGNFGKFVNLGELGRTRLGEPLRAGDVASLLVTE